LSLLPRPVIDTHHPQALLPVHCRSGPALNPTEYRVVAHRHRQSASGETRLRGRLCGGPPGAAVPLPDWSAVPRAPPLRRVAHGRWLVHIPGCDVAIDSIAIAAPPACPEREDLAVASSNDCGERSTAFRTKGTPSRCGPRHGRANLTRIFRTPTRSDLSRVAVTPVHSIRWTWLRH
jgi:hypothetical protein